MAAKKKEQLPSLSINDDGIPVFRPTFSEFQDFNKYIKKVEQTEASHIGIAKVGASSVM